MNYLMRLSEFVTESKESIETYLGMLGISISRVKTDSEKIIAYHREYRISDNKVRTYLLEINSNLEKILSDSALWERFIDDPEVELVYNDLVLVHNTNYDYLLEIQEN